MAPWPLLLGSLGAAAGSSSAWRTSQARQARFRWKRCSGSFRSQPVSSVMRMSLYLRELRWTYNLAAVASSAPNSLR